MNSVVPMVPITKHDFRALRCERHELPTHLQIAALQKLKSVQGPNGLSLHYRVGPWGNHACPKDCAYVLHRSVLCLFRKGDEWVGYAEFVEWKMTHRLQEHSFALFMDEISGSAVNMAMALLRSWTLKSFAPRGRFVEWRELAIFSSTHAKGWDELIKDFIQRRYRNARNTGGDIMVLKPFPLEFTGNVVSSEVEDVFQKRRTAMVRMYENKLGAKKIPWEEWMWISLSPNLRKPRQRPFKFDF